METDYFIQESLNAFFQMLKDRKGYNYVFMNERFYELYRMFLINNSNIDLGEVCLYKDFKRKAFKKYIFINDINYELPEDVKKNDIVKIYLRMPSLSYSFVPRLGNMTKEESAKLSCTYTFEPSRLNGIMDYLFTTGNAADVLNFLAAETNYLLECGIDSAREFLPDTIKYYFKFIDKYYEEINAFIDLYNNNIEEYRESMHSSRKSLSDRTEAQFIHRIIIELSKNSELNIDADFTRAFDKIHDTGYNVLVHEMIDFNQSNKELIKQ